MRATRRHPPPKPPHPYPPDSFGHYLQQHGLKGPHQLPLAVRGLGRRLCGAKRFTIAPNSPTLPMLAAVLKVPLAEIQQFAKGPLLTERWLKKIQAQMENNTIPRGNKMRRAMHKAAEKRARKDQQDDDDEGTLLGEIIVERRPIHPSDHDNPKPSTVRPGAGGPAPKPGSFLRFVHKHSEFTSLSELSKAARVPRGCAWLLNTKAAKVAKDSPHLDRLAETLKVPVAAVARFAKGMATSHSGHGARSRRHLAKEDHRATGKAVVHVPSNGNGNGHVPKQHNRLRKQETELRQAARDMVTSLNVSAMRGEKFSDPFPLPMLYAVLSDYLREKDPAATNMLINPRFSEFFDPR